MKTARGWSQEAAWILAALLVVAALCGGCGDPEPPQIQNVEISYWDGYSQLWLPLEDGLTAEGSPVRLQARITDNTAVVGPVLSLIGRRQDVAAWKEPEFQDACTAGAGDFYACTLEARKPVGADYFALFPVLAAADLIRGDLFVLSLTAEARTVTGTGGDTVTTVSEATFQLQVKVKEALELDPSGENLQDPVQAYRVLEVNNLLGDPNPFLWALSCATSEGEEPKPLRAGDALRLQGAGSDTSFQLFVGETVATEPEPGTMITYTLKEPTSISATWKSLTKWNQSFALSLDAKTGDFQSQFVLFDPRSEAQVADPDLAPEYGFVLSAHDVPDEGDGQVRSSTWGIDPPARFRFAPPQPVLVHAEEQDPVIVVNEFSADTTTETSTALNSLTGYFTSAAGELKGLQLLLANGESGTGYEQRVYSFDPDAFSLGGWFTGSVQFVSNWANSTQAESGQIPNLMKVAAFGMRENQVEEETGVREAAVHLTENDYDIDFSPPLLTRSSPSLQVIKFFPELNASGLTYLPPGESLRVRAWGSDDTGQPEVSYWQCSCDEELDTLNPTRALCRECRVGDAMEDRDGTPGVDAMRSNDLDATGQFPENPWRWMQVTPTSELPAMDIGVFRVSETVVDGLAPLFSAVAVTMKKQESVFPKWRTVSTPVPVSQGPLLSLTSGPANGSVYSPVPPFTISATLTPNTVAINRNLALWNGVFRGDLSFDETTQVWDWEVQEAPQAGDRICIGAESVTGHRSIALYEFLPAAGGLQVGLTYTADLRQCSVVQGAAPATLLHAYYRRDLEPDGLTSRYRRSLSASILGRDAPVSKDGILFFWNGVAVPADAYRYDEPTGNFFWEPVEEDDIVAGDRACLGTVTGGIVSAYRIAYATTPAEPEVSVTFHTDLESCEQP